MTLPAEEFLRRFLLHLLPTRLPCAIRHFGIFAHRRRRSLLPPVLPTAGRCSIT